MDSEVASVCCAAMDWFKAQGFTITEACPDFSDAEEIFQVRKPCFFLADRQNPL